MSEHIEWRKSSYSADAEVNACVELAWQKSSYSTEVDEHHCVELASAAPAAVLLRESDDPAHMITTTPAALARFLRTAQAGGFDHLGRAGQ